MFIWYYFLFPHCISLSSFSFGLSSLRWMGLRGERGLKLEDKTNVSLAGDVERRRWEINGEEPSKERRWGHGEKDFFFFSH